MKKPLLELDKWPLDLDKWPCVLCSHGHRPGKACRCGCKA